MLPEMRAIVASIAVITVLFLVGEPNLSVSVFRCGFQWGTISKTKWLVKASGIAISGFGIATAIAAPINTCGVSNICENNFTP